MPGNEVGDRVHNFFAQESLSPGPGPHSQVVDGNWALHNNLWAGNQKHIGGPSSNPKVYNPQQSEFDRGHNSQNVPGPHGFNFMQTTARPEFGRSQFQSQQPDLNGYMYGHQVFQTRPDEANFLGVGNEIDRNNVNPGGFLVYDSQQEGVSEQISNNSVRSDTSDTHGSLDLFGGQHQMNIPRPGFPSGFGDIQQLQQQLMFRKMQELQRQKDARQHNSVSQASSFARQASGSPSLGIINGTPTSDSSNWPGPELTVGNTNWLQRASSGLVFSSEPGQDQRSMGFVNQQVDQSLYGVPVASSRGPLKQFPHLANDKGPIQQIPTHGSPFPGNLYEQGLPGKSLFGYPSGQGSNSGPKMEPGQQLGTMQQNTPGPEFHGLQDLMGPSEPATAATSDSAASLDPDEEKILFGSNENIWDAFGSDINIGGDASNMLDGGESASGVPSLQSGSWSALMQSAVGEASGGGKGLQEEWSGLNFPNPERPSPYQDGEKQQTAMGYGANGAKRASDHWASQPYGPSQPTKKQNDWNAIGPVSPLNENGNLLQQNQTNDWKRVVNSNVDVVTPPINTQGGGRFSQFPSGSQHLNHWKHVESSVKSKGRENSRKPQLQVSESSFNSSDKEDLKINEISSSSKRENSNESHRSEPGDSRAKQTFSNLGGRKTSGPPKFQYHPMGNLDEDVDLPPAMSLPLPRGLRGQNFGPMKTGQVPGSTGIGKGLEGTTKASDNMFAPFGRSVGLPTSVSQPSQNMLELLHKVDQPKDSGTFRNFNSFERNLSSDTPDPEHSDGSFGGLQRTQSTNSQGFGLQLGPPSQLVPLPNRASPNPMNTISSISFSQAQPAASIRDKGNLSGNVSVNRHAPQVKHPLNLCQSHHLNIVESTSVASNLADQEAEKGANFASIKDSPSPNVSAGDVDHGQTTNGPMETDRLSDASLVKTTATRGDLEAFGRSLKPNNFHQNYSLLDQMRAMKHSDNDPSTRGPKRLKGPDNFFGSQQVGEASACPATGPPRDSQPLGFAGPADNGPRNMSSQPVNLSSKDVNEFGQNESRTHVHISPQMAPSWFDRFGTFKHGPISQRVDAVKTMEPPFSIGRISGNSKEQVSASDTIQVVINVESPGPQPVEIEKFASPPLPMNTNDQNLVTSSPKKRKRATADLDPWLKEVSGRSENLQAIRAATVDWSRATNRVMEKVGDVIERVPSMPTPHRRIIVTTQLMQQLLRPPLAAVLAAGGGPKNHEVVAYYAARLALGDACNLVSSGRTRGGANSLTIKSKESERNEDCLSEVAEGFMSKARKLEDEFSRLDKRASILDLRVEYQDVEKFSVINRFARFHMKAQPDEPEPSSPDAPKPAPQRYVTAVVLPKNLPDRVQCLSL